MSPKLEPVLLDTNAIRALDRWMESSRFQTVLDGSLQSNKCIVIPAIVLDELRYRFIQEAEDTISRARKIFGKPRVSHLDTLIEQYIRRLDVVADDPRLTISEYPSLNEEEISGIVGNMYNAKKPFRGNGTEKGFKDYLIWRSFCDFVQGNCKIGDPVHVITDNINDFCDSYGRIHRDLRIGNRNIVMWRTINEFIKYEIEPNLAIVETWRQEIMQGQYPDIDLDLKSILRMLADAMVGTHLLYEKEWIARIKQVSGIAENEINVVARRLNQNTIAASLTGFAVVETEREWKSVSSYLGLEFSESDSTLHHLHRLETMPFVISYLIDEGTKAVTRSAVELSSHDGFEPFPDFDGAG